MRLDQYTAKYWPEHSRSTWQKFIEKGYVLVNDEVETISKRVLGEDDIVTINTPPLVSHTGKTLPVVYEDDHVVVINKPSGVLTHSKGALSEEFTVADFVKSKMTEIDDTNRPGIVHRLDRDTSGIIIAGKDLSTKRMLQKQFQDRKAKKTYVAIVDGVPKQPTGNIDLPIERNPKKPAQHRVGVNGKSAQTSYQVLSHNDDYALVELKPFTGRTHQLRVHMAHIGTPILGDVVYGKAKKNKHRLCLHAKELEITIPKGNRKTFIAELPADMKVLWEEINAG